MGDFLRVSQTPVSIMAHHILNSVEAAHSLCGVEVSPQWFSLNPSEEGPGDIVLWAHLTPFGPLLLALEF